MRVSFLLYLLIVSISALGGNPPLESKGDPSKAHLTSSSAEVVDPSLNDDEPWNPELSGGKSEELDSSALTTNQAHNGSKDHRFWDRRVRREVLADDCVHRNLNKDNCYILENPNLDTLRCCKAYVVGTVDHNEFIEITDVGQEKFNEILLNGELIVSNNFAIHNTQISEIPIQLYTVNNKDVKLKIINNRNLTVLKIKNPVFEFSKVDIEISGNPSLSQEVLNNIKKGETNEIKVSYMQSEGECFFGRPIKSFEELTGCGYYRGDLTLNDKLDFSSEFPKEFKNVTGCIIIEGTTLNDISFVHQLVTQCDNENKIIQNSNLCLHPEEKKKIIDRLRPVEFSENMGYDSDNCEAICTPKYFTEKQDKECKIIEGIWEIKEWDGNPAKFENAKQIVEIRGRLTFIDGTMEKLDFPAIFPKLEVINAKKLGENALEIILNTKLKEIVFKMDLELDVVEHKNKIYTLSNEKWDVENNLINQLNEKYGKDFVQIPPRSNTRLTNVVEIESPTAAKTRKKDSKDDEDEKSGKTVGIVVGVTVPGGLIVLAVIVVVVYFVMKHYKKSKGQVIKKEEKEKELEKQRIERCIKKKAEEQREFYGAAYISLEPYGLTSLIHRNTYGNFDKEQIKLQNEELAKKIEEEKNKGSKDDDDIMQIFEPESEVVSDKIIMETKEIERKTKLEKPKQEKHKAGEREPAGGDGKPQKNVEEKATTKNTASEKKPPPEKPAPGKAADAKKSSPKQVAEEVKVKPEKMDDTEFNKWKSMTTLNELKIDLYAFKNKLKVGEDAIEDTVYIRPFKRFAGDREYAKRQHKYKELIINKQWDIDVEEEAEKLVVSQRNKLNIEDKYFLKDEPDDCDLPCPVPVEDKRKNRKKKAVIYFLHKEATHPFISQVDGITEEKKKTDLDEIMVKIKTPNIYVKQAKYTYKRMQSEPIEIFNEILAYQQENSLPGNTFDISAPLDKELNLRDGATEEYEVPPRFPKVRLFKFVHTKKAPATADKDPSLDTPIKCVPIHSANFIKSIIRAYMSIEMDRWLVLTADEYLQVCKLALEAVKKDRNRARMTCFRGRIIGEVRGQFDDLRKALCFGGSQNDGNSEHPMKLCDYVFLGNYIGDGVTNLDTLGLLFALKALKGERCILLRGAAEWMESLPMLPLKKELKHRFGKRSNEIYSAILDVFDHLSLSAHIAKNILCTHAGVAPGLLERYSKGKIIRPMQRYSDDDLFANHMMFALPNYTVNDYVSHGEYSDGGYYFGEKQLMDCLKGLGVETMFISKPLNSGWGIFGEHPVMYSLASGMNLEKKSDKLIMAVAELYDTEITINVIYQEKMDERTNGKDHKPTKPTEEGGSNNLNTTEIKNTSNVNDKKESNGEPNSKNAESDAKKPENTDGAKSAQPEATQMASNDKNPASATTGQPNETKK